MMALKLLPLLQVVIILFSPTYSYPTIYGTKRYGRLQRSNAPSWEGNGRVQPYQQQMLRTQRYPMNYYEMYPYGQNYPDDYYYPHEAMSYPVYYPRTSKYEVYQAVLPYYYDRPLMRSGFGYYGYDDSDPADLEDEVMQEAEREQREDAQPIGQEMYYENDSSNLSDNINDVNAAFLQNLIMSQMYKDSLGKSENNYDRNEEAYGKLDEFPAHNKQQQQDYFNEDEDVLELKQLVKPPYRQKELAPEERLHWFQKNANKKQHKQEKTYYDDYADEKKRSLNNNHITYTDRKVTVKPLSTRAPTTFAPKRDSRGQKEEVLLRPATPVKHPYTSPVINVVNKKDRQRTPSVYDTIKHMLDMEKSLENTGELKPAMRKRIISSEDSLTQQLSVLKKQM